VQAVATLAAPPDVQIASVEDAHPDELALQFDDAYLTLGTLQLADGVQFSEEAVRALNAIDAQLSAMSGRENRDLWTPEAIRSSGRWAQIRVLASDALAALPSDPAN
jgi:hypothetical protein